jgi:hypothetical protein
MTLVQFFFGVGLVCPCALDPGTGFLGDHESPEGGGHLFVICALVSACLLH